MCYESLILKDGSYWPGCSIGVDERALVSAMSRHERVSAA